MPSATTTDGRVLSTREANADVAGHVRKYNNGRFTPPILERMKEIREERVHIFSVSPWKQVVPMAEWGSFTIPACPEGEEYSEFLMPDWDGKMKAVPGIMMHTYTQDEHRNAWHEEDGRTWAEKLLGNDANIPKSHSLNRFGIFVAKGDHPTAKELKKANQELDTFCLELVDQARDWSTDPTKKQGISREVHFVAAKRMNLTDEDWMVSSSSKGRQKCEMCGAYSEPGVIKCGTCKEYIFDHPAYAAMLKSQEVALAEARKAV